MNARIGLEIHCQLTTLATKLFCGCRSDYRQMAPNTNICPTCVGLPGTLPRINSVAIKKALSIAIALGCSLPRTIAFFRKNYFYPDLPKNYQITQLDIYGPSSIGQDGSVEMGGRRVRILRVQLEEDPGRIIYRGESEKNLKTLVDYNRAGTPLVEIVTEPDLATPRDVRVFLNLLCDMLENIGASDVSLEGAMRADANVSIEGGDKVEIKNVGSFHDLEKAVLYEITRQTSFAERGMAVRSETRQWDEKRGITVSARSKESDADYRYFLEHDVPAIDISDAEGALRARMPESIVSRKKRYIDEYALNEQVADVLSSKPYFARLFEGTRTDKNALDLANIITTDLMGLIETRQKQTESKLDPVDLGRLADAVMSKEITRASAKTALQHMVASGDSLSKTVSDLGLGKVDAESEIATLVDDVMNSEPDAVAEATESPKAIHYIMGLVMKKCGGRADPNMVRTMIESRLGRHAS